MDFLFLSRTMLFQGVSPDSLPAVLEYLHAEEKSYARGAAVYRVGETVKSMGLVLSGRVTIENDDFWGNRSVLDSVGPGRIFAETYSSIPGEPMMVNVTAAEPSTILFLETNRILGEYPDHQELARNLLLATAQKNLNLSRRIFHTSSKTIRGRVLSYLSFEAARQKSREFEIPFSRQQLADYLSVDRSALSHELGKMRQEGILNVKRNRFSFREDPGQKSE